MSESQLHMRPTSAVDLALSPERLRFTFAMAIVWVIPVTLMLALFNEANFILVPLWSLACSSWIFGGISRMSAVEVREERESRMQDGFDLVKSRWLALFSGPLVFSIAITLFSVLVFWLINLASNWNFLGALLTIPTFVLVLISSAIALNVYLMCTIIGFDDVGVTSAAKRLISVAIKKPYYLFTILSELMSSTFFLAIFSGLIVTAAIYSAMGITSVGMDIGALMSMLQNNAHESAFVSSIRVGSIAIIVVAWLSFLVNVAAITYSAAYGGDA